MEGIVNVLKPPGMTSSNVVSDIRKVFGLRRVGHIGTLDPGAAGVLPVCLGRATRLFDILVDKEKEYIAEIAFGARTDTQDSYGKITERDEVRISEEALREVLPAFLGSQQQEAPAYSALKFGGRPLYELARKGEVVPVRVRQVTIREMDYIRQSGDNRFLFRVVCSRGTYIRTLCEDIGRALHACAHMAFLLRTASGMFRVEDAYSIAELNELQAQGALLRAVVPVEQALSFLPALQVQEQSLVDCLRHGTRLSGREWPEGLHRLYGPDGFLGVAELEPDGLRLKLQFEQGMEQ